ncbi:phage holin family protein [Agrococcus jejuensis]|uniref:Putative Holin-X, holin superfamily III n=1 Tax=Agrococcus jejuensis TaxID=399736 RepID=A0A1G8E4T0_9MICO|nr:phage holin family protein [Agrococcus jejuensis]SDH64649.1 Putative Holin-X, holin superfamily III [Agrococcus jejuensis]
MAERRSLPELLAEVPTLVVNLFRAELENLQSEVKGKVAKLGIGGALLAVAGVMAIFMLGWLLAAVNGLWQLLFAEWAAALLTAACLLVVIGILVLIGIPLLKRGAAFKEMDSLDSIKDDVNMVRGLGHAADGTSPLDDLPTRTTRTDGDLR